MRLSKLLFLVLFFLNPLIAEKVTLFTYAYQRPDLLECHLLGLQKFLTDDEVELHVCNDADKATVRARIEEVCAKMGAHHHLINFATVHQQPQNKKKKQDRRDPNEPGTRLSAIANYIVKDLAKHSDGIVVLIENDIFLTKAFSFSEYMDGYDMAFNGITVAQKEHIWPGFFIYKTSSLPDIASIDFSTGHVNKIERGCGGKSVTFLENHPNLSIRHLERPSIDENTQAMLLEDLRIDSTQKSLFSHPLYSFENFIYNRFIHFSKACNLAHYQPTFYRMKNYLLSRYLRKTYDDNQINLKELPE